MVDVLGKFINDEFLTSFSLFGNNVPVNLSERQLKSTLKLTQRRIICLPLNLLDGSTTY